MTAAQVATCGFRHASPTFDKTVQENVIRVEHVSSASEAQLRCVAHVSLDTHYYVVFPKKIENVYQSLYWSMARQRDKTDARAWLEKRGLLSRLPTYDPKLSDEITFAHSLEDLCGPRAGGALKPMHGWAIIQESALSAGKLEDDTLQCLVAAAQASGYGLGFVGNEQYERPR